jgi:hypothetical protein
MNAITCTRCGTAASGPDAPKRPPWMCLTCRLVTDPIEVSEPAKPVRGAWLIWSIVGVVLVVGIVGGWLLLRSRGVHDRLVARYPIETTAKQLSLIDREAARWRAGEDALLATLIAFEPKDPPESTKPCPLSLQIPPEASFDEGATLDEKLASSQDRDPDESLTLAYTFKPSVPQDVKNQLAVLFETASRARFHSVRGRHLAIAAIALPPIVMVLDEEHSPSIGSEESRVGGISLGRNEVLTKGYRRGVAYVFDKETGKLRCAGRFEASSSDKVSVVEAGNRWYTTSSAKDSIEIDFEDNTIAAIAKAVQAVD